MKDIEITCEVFETTEKIKNTLILMKSIFCDIITSTKIIKKLLIKTCTQ